MPNSGDSQIGEKAHAEATEASNGSSGCNEVPPKSLLAECILIVVIADGVLCTAIAHTCASRIGDDGRVDGDNVGHGKEGGQTGSDLGKKVRVLAFFALSREQMCMSDRTIHDECSIEK